MGWLGLAGVGVAMVFTVLGGYRGIAGSFTPSIVAPVSISAAELAKLPRSTTYTTTPAAPVDQDPFAATDGQVMHPITQQVVYAGPGKQPVAVLPATELDSPTWVPVVQDTPGWDRVLLPSRPDRSTGWVFTGDPASSQMVIKSSTYLIRIQLGARKLTVDDRGTTVGTWTVAVGAHATPTPTGRTFVLALLAPPQPSYSPLILPLGTHSNVFSTFGGGPGTVGMHGWPDPSVFGQAVSNGCVRVPASALHMLAGIPLGTLVLIT